MPRRSICCLRAAVERRRRAKMAVAGAASEEKLRTGAHQRVRDSLARCRPQGGGVVSRRKHVTPLAMCRHCVTSAAAASLNAEASLNSSAFWRRVARSDIFALASGASGVALVR